MNADHDDVLLEHGEHVEVRQRFDGKWTRGFTIEHATAEGYTVRRVHDGFLLPEVFAHDEVRHERRGLFHLFRH
jgi:hypothetical protein